MSKVIVTIPFHLLEMYVDIVPADWIANIIDPKEKARCTILHMMLEKEELAERERLFYTQFDSVSDYVIYIIKGIILFNEEVKSHIGDLLECCEEQAGTELMDDGLYLTLCNVYKQLYELTNFIDANKERIIDTNQQLKTYICQDTTTKKYFYQVEFIKIIKDN
jgi:hypothetical protein